METPKLGVGSILWMNFYYAKLRVLGAGLTQSKDYVRRSTKKWMARRFLEFPCTYIRRRASTLILSQFRIEFYKKIVVIRFHFLWSLRDTK